MRTIISQSVVLPAPAESSLRDVHRSREACSDHWCAGLDQRRAGVMRTDGITVVCVGIREDRGFTAETDWLLEEGGFEPSVRCVRVDHAKTTAGTGSLLTPRRRKGDSNCRSRRARI
jgi:hypothetical protein